MAALIDSLINGATHAAHWINLHPMVPAYGYFLGVGNYIYQDSKAQVHFSEPPRPPITLNATLYRGIREIIRPLFVGPLDTPENDRTLLLLDRTQNFLNASGTLDHITHLAILSEIDRIIKFTNRTGLNWTEVVRHAPAFEARGKEPWWTDEWLTRRIIATVYGTGQTALTSLPTIPPRATYSEAKCAIPTTTVYSIWKTKYIPEPTASTGRTYNKEGTGVIDDGDDGSPSPALPRIDWEGLTDNISEIFDSVIRSGKKIYARVHNTVTNNVLQNKFARSYVGKIVYKVAKKWKNYLKGLSKRTGFLGSDWEEWNNYLLGVPGKIFTFFDRTSRWKLWKGFFKRTSRQMSKTWEGTGITVPTDAIQSVLTFFDRISRWKLWKGFFKRTSRRMSETWEGTGIAVPTDAIQSVLTFFLAVLSYTFIAAQTMISYLFAFVPSPGSLLRYCLLFIATLCACSIAPCQRHLNIGPHNWDRFLWSILVAFVTWCVRVFGHNLGGFSWLDPAVIIAGYYSTEHLHGNGTRQRLKNRCSEGAQYVKDHPWAVAELALVLAYTWWFIIRAPTNYCPGWKLLLFILPIFISAVFGYNGTRGIIAALTCNGDIITSEFGNIVHPYSFWAAIVLGAYLFVAGTIREGNILPLAAYVGSLVYRLGFGRKVGTDRRARTSKEYRAPTWQEYRAQGENLAIEAYTRLRQIQQLSVGGKYISFNRWLWFLGGDICGILIVYTGSYISCVYNHIHGVGKCPSLDLDRWPGVVFLTSVPTAIWLFKLYFRDMHQVGTQLHLEYLFWPALLSSATVYGSWAVFCGFSIQDNLLALMTVLVWSLLWWDNNDMEDAKSLWEETPKFTPVDYARDFWGAVKGILLLYRRFPLRNLLRNLFGSVMRLVFFWRRDWRRLVPRWETGMTALDGTIRPSSGSGNAPSSGPPPVSPTALGSQPPEGQPFTGPNNPNVTVTYQHLREHEPDDNLVPPGASNTNVTITYECPRCRQPDCRCPTDGEENRPGEAGANAVRPKGLAADGGSPGRRRIGGMLRVFKRPSPPNPQAMASQNPILPTQPQGSAPQDLTPESASQPPAEGAGSLTERDASPGVGDDTRRDNVVVHGLRASDPDPNAGDDDDLYEDPLPNVPDRYEREPVVPKRNVIKNGENRDRAGEPGSGTAAGGRSGGGGNAAEEHGSGEDATDEPTNDLASGNFHDGSTKKHQESAAKFDRPLSSDSKVDRFEANASRRSDEQKPKKRNGEKSEDKQLEGSKSDEQSVVRQTFEELEAKNQQPGAESPQNSKTAPPQGTEEVNQADTPKDHITQPPPPTSTDSGTPKTDDHQLSTLASGASNENAEATTQDQHRDNRTLQAEASKVSNSTSESNEPTPEGPEPLPTVRQDTEQGSSAQPLTLDNAPTQQLNDDQSSLDPHTHPERPAQQPASTPSSKKFISPREEQEPETSDKTTEALPPVVTETKPTPTNEDERTSKAKPEESFKSNQEKAAIEILKPGGDQTVSQNSDDENDEDDEDDDGDESKNDEGGKTLAMQPAGGSSKSASGLAAVGSHSITSVPHRSSQTPATAQSAPSSSIVLNEPTTPNTGDATVKGYNTSTDDKGIFSTGIKNKLPTNNVTAKRDHVEHDSRDKAQQEMEANDEAKKQTQTQPEKASQDQVEEKMESDYEEKSDVKDTNNTHDDDGSHSQGSLKTKGGQRKKRGKNITSAVLAAMTPEQREEHERISAKNRQAREKAEQAKLAAMTPEERAKRERDLEDQAKKQEKELQERLAVATPEQRAKIERNLAKKARLKEQKRQQNVSGSDQLKTPTTTPGYTQATTTDRPQSQLSPAATTDEQKNALNTSRSQDALNTNSLSNTLEQATPIPTPSGKEDPSLPAKGSDAAQKDHVSEGQDPSETDTDHGRRAQTKAHAELTRQEEDDLDPLLFSNLESEQKHDPDDASDDDSEDDLYDDSSDHSDTDHPNDGASSFLVNAPQRDGAGDPPGTQSDSASKDKNDEKTEAEKRAEKRARKGKKKRGLSKAKKKLKVEGMGKAAEERTEAGDSSKKKRARSKDKKQ